MELKRTKKKGKDKKEPTKTEKYPNQLASLDNFVTVLGLSKLASQFGVHQLNASASIDSSWAAS